MKKITAYILPLLFLFVGCKKTISDVDLLLLNGYWEIEKVEMEDGEIKEYTVNTVVDYFEIEDNKGFRQKMTPQVDGDYLTNNLKENLEIIDVNGKKIMMYKTEFANWDEELISISNDKMTIVNEHDIKYYYKRYTPLLNK